MSPWDVELGSERCIAHAREGATLAVRLRHEADGVRVAVLGTLAAAEVALLVDCLATLAGRGTPRLIVDLHTATSVSRGAREALVGADLHRRLAGAQLALRGMDRRSRVRIAARRYALRRAPLPARAS